MKYGKKRFANSALAHFARRNRGASCPKVMTHPPVIEGHIPIYELTNANLVYHTTEDCALGNPNAEFIMHTLGLFHPTVTLKFTQYTFMKEAEGLDCALFPRRKRRSLRVRALSSRIHTCNCLIIEPCRGVFERASTPSRKKTWTSSALIAGCCRILSLASLRVCPTLILGVTHPE